MIKTAASMGLAGGMAGVKFTWNAMTKMFQRVDAGGAAGGAPPATPTEDQKKEAASYFDRAEDDLDQYEQFFQVAERSFEKKSGSNGCRALRGCIITR